PAYSMPLRSKVPAVVVIHDLSFVAHPEWFRLREGARRRFLVHRAARKARAILTISEFSRGELIEHLSVPAEKIHVIPPGLGTVFSRQSSVISQESSVISRLVTDDRRLTTTPQVLYVGSVFVRRHVPDLIRAFAPIARAHADAALDLVGDNRSYPYEDLP